MKGKTLALILGGIALLLIITGFVVYKTVFSGSPTSQSQSNDTITPTELPPADASIQVNLTNSTTTANAVVISVKGMASKMSTIAYELTYQSKGLVKGVNSGSKPLDVAGKDALEREIYLGTCSRNVCTPDVGVTKVSVALVFTDTAGKETQFSKDYIL